MNIAFDKSVTEAEALSAFRMARKLALIHGTNIQKPSSAEHIGGRIIKLSIGNILPMVNGISSLASKIDLMVEYDFTGYTLSPELKVSYKGKKTHVEAMDKFIKEVFEQIQQKERKESIANALEEIARAVCRQPAKKKSKFGSWFS